VLGEVAVAVKASVLQRPSTDEREVNCSLDALGKRCGESVSERLQGVVGSG